MQLIIPWIGSFLDKQVKGGTTMKTKQTATNAIKLITVIIWALLLMPRVAFAFINLSDFDAIFENSQVKLTWLTASEVDNAGFYIYRSESPDGEYVKINETLIPAKGSGTQGADYMFIDHTVQNRKTYYYKLQDIDIEGKSAFNGPASTTPRWIFGVFKLK